MTKKIKTILTIILVIIVGFIAVYVLSGNDSVIDGDISTLKGCYVANMGQTLYTLSIKGGDNNKVIGDLEFKNSEKDSSKGTIEGVYKRNILIADYSFVSEGTSSVMQVAFKKTEEGFVPGYGLIVMEGTTQKFKNTNDLTFDSSITYIPSTCVESTNI